MPGIAGVRKIALYALPTDILAPSWSLVAGSADPLYPLANLTDKDAANPFKATGATATIRATVASTTVEAVAVIGHNRGNTSWTLSSGAGAMGSLTVPADAEDGLPLSPWRDLRTQANTTSTTFDIAIPTGTGNAYVGELIWVETLRTMRVVWGTVHTDIHIAEERRTAYGIRLIEDLGVRLRRYQARVSHPNELAAMLTLYRACKGIVLPFLLIPDDIVNEAIYVRFLNPLLEQELEDPVHYNTPIEVEECSPGVIA